MKRSTTDGLVEKQNTKSRGTLGTFDNANWSDKGIARSGRETRKMNPTVSFWSVVNSML